MVNTISHYRLLDCNFLENVSAAKEYERLFPENKCISRSISPSSIDGKYQTFQLNVFVLTALFTCGALSGLLWLDSKARRERLSLLNRKRIARPSTHMLLPQLGVSGCVFGLNNLLGMVSLIRNKMILLLVFKFIIF